MKEGTANMPDSKQNTRREFEERMKENLEMAKIVKSLSYSVSYRLFGAKPEEESSDDKKSETASPFFGNAGSLTLETRGYLGEARDALEEIIKEEFESVFNDFDLILSPTAPSVAFKQGEKEDPMAMYMTDIYTVPVNIAGLPAISIPCGMSSENMPIGMQLIGKPLSEQTILNAGHVYEQTRGAFALPKL